MDDTSSSGGLRHSERLKMEKDDPDYKRALSFFDKSLCPTNRGFLKRNYKSFLGEHALGDFTVTIHSCFGFNPGGEGVKVFSEDCCASCAFSGYDHCDHPLHPDAISGIHEYVAEVL